MILKEQQIVATMIDCLVTYKCCGNGLLEVKSPHNIWNEKRTVQNWDYLEFDEDRSIHLIQNHEYWNSN